VTDMVVPLGNLNLCEHYHEPILGGVHYVHHLIHFWFLHFIFLFFTACLFICFASMFIIIVVDVAVATPDTCGTVGSTVDFCKYIA